ncbi:hypothetical protein ABFX02_05G014900 [Erythranthe guttata]
MSWIQSAFGSKISPVILFVLVVSAILFFIAALLHLLIRFLLKQRSAHFHSYPETRIPTSGSFQRQLQQLFHLHDSGLDQSHIDSLPVFLYEDVITGLKEPFDCAVCLCEFSKQDKLRLLPSCSHAFHIDCIDTWLLSNSTCPLCRGVILSTVFSFENPIFRFGDSSKEAEDSGSREENGDGITISSAVINDKRVFSVRLGKFRGVNVNNDQESEVGESSNSKLSGARRCYSMGSCQYVVDNDSELQVALCPSSRREGGGVECSGGVRAAVKGGWGQKGNFTGCEEYGDGKKINSGGKGESFSVSKIWMWSKKGGKFTSSSAITHYSNAVNVSLP